MANILFKRGTKAGLANASIVDGTIYVTTDERAMYMDYTPAPTVEVPNPTA